MPPWIVIHCKKDLVGIAHGQFSVAALPYEKKHQSNSQSTPCAVSAIAAAHVRCTKFGSDAERKMRPNSRLSNRLCAA